MYSDKFSKFEIFRKYNNYNKSIMFFCYSVCSNTEKYILDQFFLYTLFMFFEAVDQNLFFFFKYDFLNNF